MPQCCIRIYLNTYTALGLTLRIELTQFYYAAQLLEKVVERKSFLVSIYISFLPIYTFIYYVTA